MSTKPEPIHAPIPLPAGSIDFDKFHEKADKAVYGGADKYDANIEAAVKAAHAGGFEQVPLAQPAGFGLVERETELEQGNVILEKVQVYAPKDKDVVEPTMPKAPDFTSKAADAPATTSKA